MELRELTQALNQELQANQITDYCPNGLQVQGRAEVEKVLLGVSATAELIDVAIEKKMDAILVHHGFFWKNESPCITGIKHNRLKKLLTHDISLFGYHLPLDVHPELGNNVQLGKRLGFENLKGHPVDGLNNLFWEGELPQVATITELEDRVSSVLERTPLTIVGGTHGIRRIGWCTGGAQRQIEMAVSLGLDAYLSGEISESTTHVARESGVHYLSAGHHATERYGVQAVGDWLNNNFGLTCEFVDLPNPV